MRFNDAVRASPHPTNLTRQIPVHYAAGPALCRHYAEQFTRMKTAGTPIGANDLWIACHALAEDAILVTNNTREFERVAGLRLENWAEEAQLQKGIAPSSAWHWGNRGDGSISKKRRGRRVRERPAPSFSYGRK